MTKEQKLAWSILGRALRLVGDALLNVAEVHTRTARTWVPTRRRLLGGHAPLAVVFAAGFGVALGMNIVLAAVVVARTYVGVG